MAKELPNLPDRRRGSVGRLLGSDIYLELHMQCILMLYQDEAGFWFKLTPAEQKQWTAAYEEYVEALNEAGVLKGMNRFQVYLTAKTVRITDGKSEVMDGPYADSKEQLGGYFIIDVPDLDAAISWAARCPAASHGVVEVRPLWAGPPERMN
jgi:hypothetical protein